MEIRNAKTADIEGILDLLAKNHKDNLSEEERKEGFVTTAITAEQLADLIKAEDSVTVAEDKGQIVSFALAGSWEFWSAWPLFQYMIEILSQYTCGGTVLTTKNSYQYGPVCIRKDYRGTGLFEDVFFASLRNMQAKYPYMATFVNQVNPRSHAAHTRKAGMEVSGTFDFGGNHYWLMSIPTNASAPQSH